MGSAATSVVFGTARALPHGPHGLTRTEVAESQRIRLFAALTELMAEDGWAGVTIGRLVDRAGVSRSTFYEHFADKQDCLFGAYDRYATFVMETLATEFDGDTPWHDFVADVVAAYLQLLERDVTATRAFLLEMDAAGPEARGHRRAAWRSFADLLIERHESVHATEPDLVLLPRRSYLGILLAVRDLVVEVLADAGDEPDLAGLEPDITVMAMAMFRGAADAQRWFAEREGSRTDPTYRP